MSKMFMLLVLTFLVCSVSGVPTISRLISLPSYNVNLLRDAGLPSLQDKIVTARNILIQTAEQVNVTQSGCASTIESYLQADCRTCVETKCQEKADSCSPDLWGVIAVQMESFFSFHADMMITAFSAAAGMHNFFVNVAQGAFDVWGNIFGGFVNGFGSAIEGVGNLFSSLFNRRVRNVILQYHVRRQVRSEPTCDQLQNDGGNACLQYTPSCGNVCDSEWLEQQYCPTFNLAMADYQAAVQEHYWVTTIPTNHNYAINQVLVDGSSFDATVGGYTSSTVTATLFGETYTFSLDSPLTMFDMTQAGQEIAQKALDQYKSRHPAPTTKRI